MKSFKIIRPNRFFAMEVTEDGKAPQRVPLYAYMTYQPAKGCYGEFLDAGVKLISLAVYAGDRGINPISAIRPFRPGFMTAPGVYDFRWLDEDLDLAIAGRRKGEVYLLLRVMLEMPMWWEEAHPEARSLDFSGVPLHCSFSSEKWLSACVDALDALHRHLCETGRSDYIAGYHLAAGQTEEFVRPKFHHRQYFDYSDASLVHFRTWCKKQYRDDIHALNQKWNTQYLSFDDIEKPSAHERRYFRAGAFRDPAFEQKTIDHTHFVSEELAEFIVELAHRAKKLCGGKKLIGAFYGYNSLTDPDMGHNAVSSVFNSPDIDFLASPFFYTGGRSPYMDWPFQGPIESAALHGKPWFTEADVRTYLSRPIKECMPFADPGTNQWYLTSVWYGPDTLDTSLSQIKRAFARIFTHDSAVWWFDMWGGWYADDTMMDFHRLAQSMYADAVLSPTPSKLPPLHAQLAVFVDKSAADGMTCAYAGVLVSRQLEQLGTLGAPYDVYTIEDFAIVDPSNYRMALILSPSNRLSPDALSKWKSDNRTLFFVGLPGYFGDTADLGADTEISCSRSPGTRSLAPDDETGFPSNPIQMPAVTLSPGDMDTVIATAGGDPIAVLHFGCGYQTVWCLLPSPPTEMLREQLQLSGGHIYNFTDDVIYARDNMIAILSCADSDRRIHFPYPCEAYNAITGGRLPGTALVTDLQMKKGETIILRLEKIKSAFPSSETERNLQC